MPSTFHFCSLGPAAARGAMSVLYLLAKVYCFSRSLRLLFKVSNADMLCRYHQYTLRKESMSKHIHLSCLLEARHAIIKRGRGTISMAAAILPQAFVEEDSRQRHRRIESSCLIIRVRLLLRRRILILTAAMFVRRPRWRRRSRNKLTCIALFTCFESAEALTDQQETANAMVLYDIVSGMLHTCIRSSMLVRPSHSAFLRLHKKRDLFSLPTIAVVVSLLLLIVPASIMLKQIRASVQSLETACCSSASINIESLRMRVYVRSCYCR